MAILNYPAELNLVFFAAPLHFTYISHGIVHKNFKTFYVINSVNNTKLPCYILPPMQHNR